MLVASALGLFCISVGASAVGGVLGMAGGIFIVPVLTIIVGLDIHVAIGASIVSVIACSCGSAASFLRERLTNVRLAIVLETATTLGAASGVLLSGVVPVPARATLAERNYGTPLECGWRTRSRAQLPKSRGLSRNTNSRGRSARSRCKARSSWDC
jgi:hypothetical protein